MKSKGVLKMSTIWYLGISTLIILLLYIVDPAKDKVVIKTLSGTFAQTIEIIIAVFIFIGLLQIWVRPETIGKLLGKEAGFKGLLYASTFPMFIGGSLFTILPLMKTLREKGARIGAIAAFITAWGEKIPLFPLEVKFLGLPFAFLRLILIIPFALSIGAFLELVCRGRCEEESKKSKP